LQAFRQKKAKERLDRMERIQKRLQQIRDQSATVAGRGAVEKPAARLPSNRPIADRPPSSCLLKDSTNRVTSSSVKVAKRELPARAKLIARRLKQSGSADMTSAGRRVTVTLSSASETNDTEAGQNCGTGLENNNDGVQNSGETAAADENVPQLNDVCADTNISHENSCKPTLGKR